MFDIGIGIGIDALGYGAAGILAGKLVDQVLDRLTGKKIVEPAFDAARWRWRAFKTRGDPLDATFEVKFSPESKISVCQARELVSEGLAETSDVSKNRVTLGTLSWDEDDQGKGFMDVDYIGSKFPFSLEISLLEDVDDLRKRPAVSFGERYVDGIHFKINFKFPFHSLEDTIQNLGAFASFLNKGMNKAMDVTTSPGQFIVHPVKSDLTLDEWIKEDGFDVSLLLANGRDGVERTEVEFFPDRAEIHPPHLEVDSETTRYIRLLILNYYLRKG